MSLEALTFDLCGRDRERPPRSFKVAEGVPSDRWPNPGDVLMIHCVGPLLVRDVVQIDGRAVVFYVPYDDDLEAVGVWRMRTRVTSRGFNGRSVEEEAFPA